MAYPGPPGHRSRHSRNLSTVISGPALINTAPRIEMVPNPDFAFPRRPHTATTFVEPAPTSTGGSRPISMQDQRPSTAGFSHRRTASTLPSFSFNAADTSGLRADPDQTPPLTPNDTTPSEYADLELEPEQAAITPSRHRRTNSEFVGGDSRLGVSGAISSSPTKTVPSAGLSGKPFTHRHRRSVAVSSHDLKDIMEPAEPKPRLSASLPTTPLDPPISSSHVESLGFPPITNSDLVDPFGPADDDADDDDDDASIRPPSRPRVGFSDNIEFIPRPLSTISSETESSMSTVRCHSVNNSISSVLSLGTPSPPSSRARTSTLETTFEDEPRSKARSSLEISKRVEREGKWFRPGQPQPNSTRSGSLLAGKPAKVSFAANDVPAKAHHLRTLRPFRDFDRRRSETEIGMYTDEPTRHSALSLQEQTMTRPLSEHSGSYMFDNSSSRNKTKIKDWKGWAKSKISRKRKSVAGEQWEESASTSSVDLTPSETPSTVSVPGLVPIESPSVAETNLDAVFASQASPVQSQASLARIDFRESDLNQQPSRRSLDSDDHGYMLDLDAALGPFKTPHPLAPPFQHRPIRELHSSRLTKDFGGPGGHYYPEPSHRRTKSTPTGKLDQALYLPGQERMHDVFEEEEEEENETMVAMRSEDEVQEKGAIHEHEPSFPDATRPASLYSTPDEEAGTGVQIVDSEPSAGSSSLSLGLDTDVRMSQGSWDLERPSTSYGIMSSRLSTPIVERRASSLIEETIIEESSPVEPVEIVQAYEEPRAPSLTKSSDSSETPTVLGAQPGVLNFNEVPQSISTSDTYQTSTFSTPDFGRRQGSFDNSRVGTAASSIADSRTMSSYTTGEPTPDVRMSVDDVPSLTSSRSTATSTFPANLSRRDISGARTPSAQSTPTDAALASEERRRKRSSIQSLSQLMGGSFGPRSSVIDDSRPRTATDAATDVGLRKKDNRLKKLMFWKSKHRQASTNTTMTT